METEGLPIPQTLVDSPTMKRDPTGPSRVEEMRFFLISEEKPQFLMSSVFHGVNYDPGFSLYVWRKLFKLDG